MSFVHRTTLARKPVSVVNRRYQLADRGVHRPLPSRLFRLIQVLCDAGDLAGAQAAAEVLAEISKSSSLSGSTTMTSPAAPYLELAAARMIAMQDECSERSLGLFSKIASGYKKFSRDDPTTYLTLVVSECSSYIVDSRAGSSVTSKQCGADHSVATETFLCTKKSTRKEYAGNRLYSLVPLLERPLRFAHYDNIAYFVTL